MKIGSAPSVPAAISPEENEKLLNASRAYEALFVNQLVTEMRKTITRSGLVPESHAEKVYQGMLDSEYAQKIAESDQLGLARMIYDQLLRQASGK